MSGTCRGSGSRGTSPAGSRASPWMRRLVTTRRRRSGTRDVSSRHRTAREREETERPEASDGKRGEKTLPVGASVSALGSRGRDFDAVRRDALDARLFLDGYARVSHAAPSRYSRELFGDGDDSRRNRGGGYHQTRRRFERDTTTDFASSSRCAARTRDRRGRRRRRRRRSPVEPTRVSPELGRVHGRPAAAAHRPAGGGERREAGGERRDATSTPPRSRRRR